MGSTGQCEIHGRKRVKFGNKLVNVQFSVNSFKIAFGVGLFESLLTKSFQICCVDVPHLYHLCKIRMYTAEMVLLLQYNVVLIQAVL